MWRDQGQVGLHDGREAVWVVTIHVPLLPDQQTPYDITPAVNECPFSIIHTKKKTRYKCKCFQSVRPKPKKNIINTTNDGNKTTCHKMTHGSEPTIIDTTISLLSYYFYCTSILLPFETTSHAAKVNAWKPQDLHHATLSRRAWKPAPSIQHYH